MFTLAAAWSISLMVLWFHLRLKVIWCAKGHFYLGWSMLRHFSLTIRQLFTVPYFSDDFLSSQHYSVERWMLKNWKTFFFVDDFLKLNRGWYFGWKSFVVLSWTKNRMILKRSFAATRDTSRNINHLCFCWYCGSNSNPTPDRFFVSSKSNQSHDKKNLLITNVISWELFYKPSFNIEQFLI